jgi:GNAT superfamily N-acetyltransferase
MGTAGNANGWQGEIKPAGVGDADGVAALAAELAQSFAFSPERFRVSYLLGFCHLTFYANGPVGWVEEVVVRGHDRGQGIGGALMSAFEQWAAAQGCALVALATRRAAPFYRAVGESATCFRKVLVSQPRS